MNLWPFHRPDPRQPLRAIVATRSESKAVQRKREETTAALRKYVDSRPAIVSKGRG